MKFEFYYNKINFNIFHYNPSKNVSTFLFLYICTAYIYDFIEKIVNYWCCMLSMNAFLTLLYPNAAHVLAAVQNLDIYAFHNCSLNHHSCYI